MTHRHLFRMFAVVIAALVAFGPASDASAQPAAPKAHAPVLVTSCGQSPGPLKLTVFLKRLGIDFEYKSDATAQGPRRQEVQDDHHRHRCQPEGHGRRRRVDEGRVGADRRPHRGGEEAGVMLIGAHIEGMARRSQGAAAGDNSDEQSIDAVCPHSQILLVRKDGDEDGRFTTIAKKHNIPMLAFEKNLDVEGVLKSLFGK